MKPALKKPGKLKLKNMKPEKKQQEQEDERPRIFPEELRTKDKVVEQK